MIPEGTSPNEIVAAIAFTLFAFSLIALVFFWYRLPDPLRDIMSRLWHWAIADRIVVRPVVQPMRAAGQPIATTNNAGNAELSGNSPLSEDARDIIRFQAKVEALAALIRDGQITNVAKGIEKAFQCSRSSKDDSTYQKALRVLRPMIQSGPAYQPLDDNRQPILDAK